MLIVADARTLPLRPHFAHLVYADPPHTMGEHAYDKSEAHMTYPMFTKTWLAHAVRCMHSNSYLVITASSLTHPIIRTIMTQEHRYISFVQELVWFYNFGTYTKKKFVESHQTLIVYRQGHPKFHWEAVAIESQRQQSGDSRADHRGRTPPTVLQYPRVPGNSHERDYLGGAKGRSSQPRELCEVLVKAYTLPGQKVLDLFTGSGSMYKAAKVAGRSVVGVDIQELFINQTRTRVKEGWKRLV